MLNFHALSAAALACTAVASVPASNPFAAGDPYYVNPTFVAEINSSIATCTDPTTCTNLRLMQKVPSAFWIDTRSKIAGNANDTTKVAGVLADAASRNPPELVVFIVYDLPNRDCHAKASNGEICCYYNSDGTCNYDQTGDCSAGIQEYESTYIDPLVKLFAQYQNKVPIVAIIEPDSLPNLATNMGDPHCGNSATVAAYKTGIPYAVTQIGTLARGVTMYLDAAHGGWLGWENNMADFATLINSLDITQYIRGFATNTANYQPLGLPCPAFDWCLNNQHPDDACCSDPCDLLSQYNPSNNEHNYVLQLANSFASIQPGFLIDTGRNGVPNARSNCANWCNIRNSGAGTTPSTNTSYAAIDAYYWLKTPGESDGCTQNLPNGTACARFDSMCASTDSIGSESNEPRAPTAGAWFDYMVQMLAKNAQL